jgi:hypothetical protein
VAFIWDLQDDPEGTSASKATALRGKKSKRCRRGTTKARSAAGAAANLKAFGWTASGKYVTVVFQCVSDDPLTVYPITAYEVRPPDPRKRRKER